jgi:putative NADPH-quinone reductase
MRTQPLIIFGSARHKSYTAFFTEHVFKNMDKQVIDLLDHYIAPYGYHAEYPETDKFYFIIQRVLQHQTIVFATPVYWYAMSAQMKMFFDRLTDLVTTQKETGRKLKGKSVFLLAVGADPELPPGFEVPFKLAAEYLDMRYSNCIYFAKHETALTKHETKISDNIDCIKKSVKS